MLSGPAITIPSNPEGIWPSPGLASARSETTCRYGLGLLSGMQVVC